MARRIFGALVMLTALSARPSPLAAARPSTTGSAGAEPTTAGPRSRTAARIVVGAEQEPDCFDWIGTVRGLARGARGSPRSKRSRWRSARSSTATTSNGDRRAAVLAGPPTVRSGPGGDDHLQHQPGRGVVRRCADHVRRLPVHRRSRSSSGPDIYDPTGYIDIDKVIVPDAEDRRGHVQERQELRGLAGAVLERRAASSRRTSSRARTATS